LEEQGVLSRIFVTDPLVNGLTHSDLESLDKH